MQQRDPVVTFRVFHLHGDPIDLPFTEVATDDGWYVSGSVTAPMRVLHVELLRADGSVIGSVRVNPPNVDALDTIRIHRRGDLDATPRP